MTLVIVGHPVAGYSGYQRAAGRGFYFSQGETELVDLTPAQQTALTSVGYTVDGLPDPPTPDPFPQYPTLPEVRQFVTTDEAVLAAQRAASVAALEDADTVAPTGAWDFTGATVTGVAGGGGTGGSGITAGTAAGQIPVWDGNSYEPQTPADAVAADVPFTPTGRVAATNVQAAIAEVDAEKSLLIEAVNTVAASGAAVTLPDVTTATIHDVTLTANCTLTFPTVAAGKSLLVRLTQDATGSRTVTWPATVKWPGGLAPTLSTAAGKQDVISLTSIGGTNWSGFVAGLDIR